MSLKTLKKISIFKTPKHRYRYTSVDMHFFFLIVQKFKKNNDFSKSDKLKEKRHLNDIGTFPKHAPDNRTNSSICKLICNYWDRNSGPY